MKDMGTYFWTSRPMGMENCACSHLTCQVCVLVSSLCRPSKRRYAIHLCEARLAKWMASLAWQLDLDPQKPENRNDETW